MDKSAVVLARNYSTALSVIRGLGMAGYEVDLVITVRDKDAKQAHIAANSKYVKASHILTGRKYSEDTDQKVIDCLKSYEGMHLLFPIDDYSVMLVDQHREELSEHFIMPYIVGGGLRELSRLMDKTVQSDIARAVGMKVPKEWVLDLSSFEIPSDMCYPCFVKPLQSVLGYKTEMKRCDDAQTLAEHLAKLVERNRDRSILIQEFLTIDEEISMSGVCADQEILLPALVAKSRIGKHETGVTLSGSLVPVETVGERTVYEILEVLKAFHYVGQFDMEVLRCGEEYYFGEVNLRSGGPNFAYTLNGVNLPMIAANAIEGSLKGESNFFEDVPEITYHKPFVYEKVAWEDYLNFRISKRELNEILSETEDKLLNWAPDPAPGMLFDEIMKQLKVVERGRALGKKTPVYKGYLLAKSLKSADLKKPLKHAHTITPEDILEGRALQPKKNKRVILLGRNYSSLIGMIRALAEGDYEIEVVRLFRTTPKRRRVYMRMVPEGFSRYVSRYHICVTNNEEEKLVKLLMGLYREEKPTLLLPTDDYPLSILDGNYDKLKAYFALPDAEKTEGHLKALMDLETQKQLLGAAGFQVAEPTLNIEKEYALLGLSTDDQVMIPDGMVQMLKSGQGEQKSVTMVGKVVSTEPVKDLVEQVKAFMKTLQVTGLFNLDLVEAEGRLYIRDIKLRFGASGYAITACGVNLPKMFTDYMLNQTPIDQNAQITKLDKIFVSEKVLMEAHGVRAVSRNFVKKTLKGADIHLIEDQVDPKPYHYMKKFYKYSLLAPFGTGKKK